MHPEIMRELTTQHGRDLREKARRANAGRALRRGAHTGEEFAVPSIPDYVDGSFRTGPDEAASQVHSQVPAARSAA